MTTSTLTITDFLLARIAEDEAFAQHSIDGDLDYLPSITTRRGDVIYLGPHDPARVLAECAAKRAIVEMCKTHLSSGGGYDDDALLADATLRALATIYADHEDYRADWS